MSTQILRAAATVVLLALAGCASFAPDKPVRPSLYDLGPLPAAEATASPSGTPLVLAEVDANGAFDGSGMLYRLAYSDAHQLRAYAFARWSASPAQLVHQRLRERLGRDRPVMDSGAAAALSRRGDSAPRVLRVELEEFSHQFDTQTDSRGVVRLRCTLLETGSGGERLVAQRSFAAQRPAPTPDAPGGVKALTAATDAAAQDIAAWLVQAR